MLKTISFRNLITLPKLKMKKNGRVYDKEWNTWFSCEEERQDFIRGIAEAEEDEREGRTGTLEELITEFEETYGIELQHYSR